MSIAALIFPHQLFKNHPALLNSPQTVLLIEHPLFFADQRYPLKLHKQKLAYHRATMKAYQGRLQKQGLDCTLVPFQTVDPLLELCKQLAADGHDTLRVVDVHDYELGRRLQGAATKTNLALDILDTPGFLNQTLVNQQWRKSRKRWFMADFYQWQRKRLDVLMENDKPLGGKWSFDEDNRRKLPKKQLPYLCSLPMVEKTDLVKKAIESVEREFPHNPGSLGSWFYPVTSEAAENWLLAFLEERFAQFGDYEDAIVEDQNFLYHAVLTPMLNIGLITPEYVLDTTLQFAKENDIPINSVEGFVRQIVGWREFMRATYVDLGVQMRTTNHWQHSRAMPEAFYTGTTGILPVDNAIKRIIETGYCHHIERLMVLGGFMFLCKIDPDDIYRWFMEMFVDSYDWVMVPNVYAMSQNADGGNITTKPYFSGSNYVIKMSHYKKGPWSDIWDALFWCWIIENSDSLKGNPRWSMMVRNAEKMDDDKKNAYKKVADGFIDQLFLS